MKKITNKYLLFTKRSEFNSRTMKFFIMRLIILLGVYPDGRKKLPRLVLEAISDSRAAYDETDNTITFDLNKYEIASDSFFYEKDKLESKIDVDIDDYKYAVPLADIYHEVVHYFQYNYTDYKNTALIEAVAETYTVMLTGETDIDYKQEVLALWYVITKILKYDEAQFYIFIRDSILSKGHMHIHFVTNRDFVNMLTHKFDSTVNLFYRDFVKEFHPHANETKCFDFLLNINKIIYTS
jgi:hypothetical protein